MDPFWTQTTRDRKNNKGPALPMEGKCGTFAYIQITVCALAFTPSA